MPVTAMLYALFHDTSVKVILKSNKNASPYMETFYNHFPFFAKIAGRQQ